MNSVNMINTQFRLRFTFFAAPKNGRIRPRNRGAAAPRQKTVGNNFKTVGYNFETVRLSEQFRPSFHPWSQPPILRRDSSLWWALMCIKTLTSTWVSLLVSRSIHYRITFCYSCSLFLPFLFVVAVARPSALAAIDS